MISRLRLIAAGCAALLFAGAAQAGCYTVLDARGNIVSQTSTPPVDMSYQLHQTVQYRYGKGATMVFGVADPDCGPAADPWEAMRPSKVNGTMRSQRSRRAPRADRG